MEIVLTNADTLEHVFSFLDVSSVCKCNQVCKLWHEVLQDNSKVWYSLCVRHWPWKWDSNYTEQLNNTINWKHIYQHIGSVNNNTFTSSIVVGCATTAVRWILNGKETLTPEQIENLLCFVRRFPTLSFYKETETINDHEEAELAAIDPKLRANVFIPTWWKNLRSVLSFVEPSANYVAVKLTRTEHPCHLGKCGLRLLKHNNIISLGGAATKIAKIYTVFRGEGTVTPDSLQCSADFHLWGIDIMTPEARLKKQMQKAEKEAKAAEKRNARPEAANNNTSDGNNSDDDDSNVLRDLLAALDLAAESDNGSSDTTAPEETSPPKFTIPKNALVPPPPEAIYEWCLGAMTAGKVRVFDSYTKLLANISSITTQNRESVEAMDYITYKGTLVLDVYCTPITEMNQSNRKLLTSSMIKHIQKLTQRVNIDVSCKGDISCVWDIPVNFQHLFGLESPPASTNTNLKLRIVGKVIAGQDVLGYAEITQGEPEMSEEEGSLNSSIEIAPPTKSAREPTLNLSINHHATSSFNVSIKNTSTVDLENSDAEDVVLDKDDSLPVPPAAPPGPTLEDIRAQLARADVMKFTGKVNYNISGTLLGGMSLVFQPVTWSLNDNEQNPLAVLEIISGMLRCISGIVENDQNMDNHYLNLSTSTEITNNNNNNAALSVSRFDLINGSKMEKQTLTAINSLVGGNNDPFHILNYLQKELLTKWQPSVIKAVVHTLQENEGGGWESHLQLGHPLLFVAHQRLQCLITHLYNRPNRSSILHNINALLDRELDNYLLLIEHFRKLEINAAKVKLLEPEPPKKETRNRRNTDEEPNREETEESHSYIYYESHNFFDLLHADEAADPRPTIPTRIAFPIALSPLLNNHNNIQSRNLTIVGKALDSPDRYGTVGCTAYLDKLRAIIDNSGYFPMESETDQAISPFLCEMLRYYTNLLFRTGVYNYNCALGILLYGGVQTETSVHLIGQLVAAAQSLKAAQGFSKSRTVFNNLVGELLLEYAGASENMAEESDDNSNNNNNNNNSRTIRNMKHKDSKLKQYCVEQVVQNFATWAHCVFKHLTFTNLSMTFIDINCLIILEKIGDSPEVISKLPLIVINKCITHLRLSKWYAYNMYERIDKLLDKYTQLHSQIKETTHEIPIESEREEFLLSPSVKSSELNDYYEQRWTLTRSALHEASQNPPNAHATTAALAAAIAATTSNMAATGGPGITTAAIPVAPGLLQHLANTNWIFPDWLRFEDLPKLYWVSDDQPLSRGAQRWLLYHILHLHKGDPGTPMLLDHLGGIDAQRLQELVSVISLIRKPELHKLAERVTNQFLTDHSFGSNIQQNLTALYIDNKSQMSVMDTLALIGDEFTVEYYIRKEINQIQQILTRLLSPSPPPTNNQLRNQLQMLQKAQHMQLRTQLRVLMDCIKQLLKNHHSYTSYYWFSRLCDFTLEVGARPYSNVWQMREAAKKGFTGFHDFCDMLISNHLRNLVSQLTEQKNSYSYHTTSTELTERIEEDITFLFNRLKTAMTSERIFTWKQLRENFFETFRVAEKVSPRARDFDAILFQLVDPTSDNSVLFQYCMDSFQGFDLEDHPVKFSDDSLFKVAHPLSLYFLAERLNIKPPQAEPTVAVQPEAQQTSSASNETVAFQDKDEEVPQPATVTEATELILPNALVINPLIQHWEKKLTHLGQTAQPFDQLYRPVYLERIPFAKLFEGYKFSSTDALEDILSRRGYLSLHVEGSNNNQQISKRIKCLGDDFFVVISYVLTRGKARPTHLVEFELAIIPTRSEEFKLKEEHFIPAESVSDVFYSEALSELVGVLKKQGPPTTQLTLYQQMNLPVNWEYEFMEF